MFFQIVHDDDTINILIVKTLGTLMQTPLPCGTTTAPTYSLNPDCVCNSSSKRFKSMVVDMTSANVNLCKTLTIHSQAIFGTTTISSLGDYDN